MRITQMYERHDEELADGIAALSVLILVGVILASNPADTEHLFTVILVLAFLLAGFSIYLKWDVLKAAMDW